MKVSQERYVSVSAMSAHTLCEIHHGTTDGSGMFRIKMSGKSY